MNLKWGIVHEAFKYHDDTLWSSPLNIGVNQSTIFNNKHLDITCGKGDWAAFQVVLNSDERCNVSVGTRPTFSPIGPLQNIRLSTEVEGMDEKNISMNLIGLIEDDDRIEKADILLNDDVIYLDTDNTQSIWVEINIPENIKPGIYNGKVNIFKQSMFENEEKIGDLDFSIEVKDVSLPKTSDYKFHLDLWQHLSNIARKHEVKLWSDEHFKVIEEYVKSLADLGQKAITIIASEIPWSGQWCSKTRNYLSDMFEYNYIKVTKKNDGTFEYDFSNVERYINLCMKYGISEEIEVLGFVSIWNDPQSGYGKIVENYPDAIRIRYLDKGDGCYKYMTNLEDVKEYIKAVEKFFIDKNWIDKVRVAADEPADKEVYGFVLNMLKEITPSFKYKTAINHVDFIGESRDKVEDFVPSLNVTADRWDELESMRHLIKGRLSYYVCCGPEYPNTFICSPLLESRFIGILTSYLNLDGFLRWNYTVWPENPREKLPYKYPCWKAGDTNFVYPANNGIPLLTLRYKNLKRGIQEFELIEKIKQSHPNKEKILEKIWNRVIKEKDIRKFYNKGIAKEDLYSLDYEDYNEVRKILLAELSKIN